MMRPASMFGIFGLSLVAVLAIGAMAADGIVAPGVELEKLAGDFKFTEGPIADAQGNVYFTDQPNDRILKWSIDGQLSTFMQPCGRSNGMYFDAGPQAAGPGGRRLRTTQRDHRHA